MRNPKLPERSQHNNSAMPIQSLLQIIDSFLRRPLRKISRHHPVRSPLGQNQFHNRFAPSGSRDSSTGIIRITSAPNQRRIPQPPRSLIQSPASRSSSSNVAVTVKRHRAHSVMRNLRSKHFAPRRSRVPHFSRAFCARSGGFRLILAQPFHLSRNNQLVVRTQLHAMLRRKSLRPLPHKINMRTLTQNLPRRPHRIPHPLHAPHAASPQSSPVHNQSIQLHAPVAIQKTPAPRIKSLVVLHHHNSFLNSIQSRAATNKHPPSRSQSIPHSQQMSLDHGIRHSPGPTMNHQHRINSQENSPEKSKTTNSLASQPDFQSTPSADVNVTAVKCQ